MQLKPGHKAGTWQSTCTDTFLDCARQGSPDGWTLAKKRLQQKDRIVLADADFSNAVLKEFDLSRCYIIRCDFVAADLRKSSFRQAMIRDSNFAQADLREANLEHADFSGGNLFKIKFDTKTNLNLASQISTVNHARPALAEEVRRQQIIDDFGHHAAGKISRWFYKLLIWGSNLKNFAVALGVTNLLFAILYFTFGEFGLFDKGYSGIGESILLTLQRFFNAQSSVESSEGLVRFSFVIHSGLGLLALGIFTALLSKRLLAALR